MGKMLNEFKAFAVKGNAVDMAVGVIIGGAFGKIVSSIVNDIIMPPIGWLIGGVNFSDLKFELPAVNLGMETMKPATINSASYTHVTLPTNREVEDFEGGGQFRKKERKQAQR